MAHGVIESLRQDQTQAQQEIEQLSAALDQAKAAGSEVEEARAAAEAQLEQREQVAEASKAEAARLYEELKTARQQMSDLRFGLADAQSNLKDLESDFVTLGKSIEDRIEELFITATLQSADNISQLKNKLGATTDQIDQLSETVVMDGMGDSQKLTEQ
jgi:chromosome segregation ATPase